MNSRPFSEGDSRKTCATRGNYLRRVSIRRRFFDSGLSFHRVATDQSATSASATPATSNCSRCFPVRERVRNRRSPRVEDVLQHDATPTEKAQSLTLRTSNLHNLRESNVSVHRSIEAAQP